MSIGQGRVKTTPVQIARMMAAIGNTEYVYNARLVKQVQDVNHNVMEVYPPVVRNKLSVNRYALAAIRKGMDHVVNASFGTGKAGAHPVTVAAKTGTGQWKPEKNQNIAWFAGYFPIQNPVYSFAIVYEGNPGEKVSGGKKAAPIISEFLNTYLTPERLNDVLKRSRELRGDYNPSPTYTDTSSYLNNWQVSRAEPESIFRSSTGQVSTDPNTVEAEPVPEPTRTQPPANTKRRNNLFNRIFNRGRR